MGVVRDEARNDGLARIVDDFRITGNRRCGGGTNGDDASVADDDGGVVDGSAACSIDYAGAAQRSRLGMRSGGCADNARHGKSPERIKYPRTKHPEPPIKYTAVVGHGCRLLHISQQFAPEVLARLGLN